MNNITIKVHEYESEKEYLCPICRETFTESDQIVLIKHHDASVHRPEKLDLSRKRKHLFHQSCLRSYIESLPVNVSEVTCPLDREKVSGLINVPYYSVVSLNLMHFSHNYYKLIDQKHDMCISIVDLDNLDHTDENGKTLFYCACQRGNLRLIRRLIQLNCNPNVPDKSGFSPLMGAVCHKYVKVVRYLLTIPVVINEINHVDHKGKTALEYALEYRSFQCMKQLLKIKGLDLQIVSQIFESYRYSMKSESLFSSNSIFIEIRNLLEKYLGSEEISCPCLGIGKLHEKKQPRTPDVILDINFEEDPDLYRLIYQPIHVPLDGSLRH